MCPPPVPTHLLSLFVTFLMVLLMGSRGKSCHINFDATFNSHRFWLWSEIVVFLQRSSPLVIIQRVQIRRVWGHWSFSMKPGQLTLSHSCARSAYALVRRLAERWIQLAANAFNLKLILEAGDQRNMQHPLSPIHEQTQSTFATKTNTSRYRNMWSELVAFNGQAIRSDSDVQLRWFPDFFCVGTAGGHIEHKLQSHIKCVW